LLDNQTRHPFVPIPDQRRWLARLSGLPVVLLLHGLALLGEILFTERVALMRYRWEGSTNDMLTSM
jgi:hypothetical protein